MSDKTCGSCPAYDATDSVCRRRPALDGWPKVVSDKDWCIEGRALIQSLEMDRLREEMMKAETGQRAAMGALRGW